MIVMVTDGLVEAVDLPLDEGMDRTRTALAGADPADPGKWPTNCSANSTLGRTTWRCCCCATTA